MSRLVACLVIPALLAAGPAQKVTAPVEPVVQAPAGGKPAVRMPEPQAMPAPESAEAPASSADTPQPFDASAYRDLVKQAQSALTQKDWAQAGRALEQALAMKPDAREVAYNLGVARFQQGDYAGAARSFQQSAQSANAKLAARSMYNQGNSVYAETLKSLPQLPEGDAKTAPPIAPEALQQAVQQVEQALTLFKDAAAANPSDEDSAANAETSLRLLKELRKLQQQQQENQKDQKKEQKDKQEPKDQKRPSQPQDQKSDQDQQQKQDQREDQGEKDRQDPKDQPNSAPQDQQQGSGQQGPEPKEQPKPQSGGKESDQPKGQDSPEQNPKDPEQDPKNKPQQQPQGGPKQEPKPQGKDQKPEGEDQKPQPQEQKAQGSQPQQAGQPPRSAEGQQAQGQREGMDKQQADQLLQLVRDKEKERNAQKRQAAGQARQTPVDRDW